MTYRSLYLTAVALLVLLPGGYAADDPPLTLTGWGIDEHNLDTFMADAAAVGFDALITWTTDPAVLAKAVAAGDRNHLKVFSCLSPMGSVEKLWSQRYPDRPVPWQVMSEDEQAARRFILAGNNQFLIPYQFGGEPALTNEVLGTRILCLNNEEARELFKPAIDAIVSVPGIGGLAFDGFGYQNYRGCHCGHCQELLQRYEAAHPEMTADAAEVAFFRDTLVNYVNYLADYARSRQAGIPTSIHIWPVFAPEPLYGNRLDLDLCGQTAAWYTLWPERKIAEYSRMISSEARKYYPRQEGVGMIGYYDRPGQFPVKDAARVDLELRTMLGNGCRSIQVCSTRDVLKRREIAAAFSRYFR